MIIYYYIILFHCNDAHSKLTFNQDLLTTYDNKVDIIWTQHYNWFIRVCIGLEGINHAIGYLILCSVSKIHVR